MASLPDPADLWGEPPSPVSAEERALATALAALDRADRDAGLLEDADLGEPPVWDVEPFSDDDVVRALRGPVCAADLMLLESIDLASLSENLDRVQYLRAVERVEAFTASLRNRAIVAMAGASSSAAYLSEVHLEHELSVARRTSAYAAGKAIEVARALEVTFPGFAAALRAGEVSEAHCRILVEKTRVVADESVLPEPSAGSCRGRRAWRPPSSGRRSRRRSPGWTGMPRPG